MDVYGCSWRTNYQIEIELECIRRGGKWKNKAGKVLGRGLLYHYRTLQSLIAPWKRWDRWSILILDRMIHNRMTILTGPASSTKTHNIAFYGLCRYLLNPTNQCVVVTSTDSRSLELKIWGEIKKLWSQCCSVWPDTPGRIIESRQTIVTDIEDTEATDYRNGIVAIPTIIGGSFVGQSRFQGIKNGNVLLLADELSVMPHAFYDIIANLRKNPDFQVIGAGNPKDRTDVLGKLAEPHADIGGWENYEPTGKTYQYKTRFAEGEAIVLDGRDSPNNDTPPGQPPLYPYIITAEHIRQDCDYYGEDSVQVSMFDYGTFPRDAQAKRVITRTLCEKFRAFEEPTWSHDTRTDIFAIDAAYGAVGGDRCVGVHLEFGACTDGVQRLSFATQPMIIPVSNKSDKMAEDQIVDFVERYCTEHDIPPHHVGLDSTGRGSLMAAFGRIWSPLVIPVEFGGGASERPVSAKNPVPCNRYYSNFVSELWYQSRSLIESDQLRKLPINVMEEGCMRGWDHVAGNKIRVEPKDKCKERMSRSPDLYDAFVVAIELALRLGFRIAGSAKARGVFPNWMNELKERHLKIRKRQELYAIAT